MAAYAMTRQRTLRGMGKTYSFVPRGRGLRGLGQDATDIDVVTGLPCDDPRANCGPVTPFTFTDVRPNVPKPQPIAISSPTFSAAASPSGVQIVFPSQGQIPAPPKFAPVPAAAPSWFDQQMISGVPNTYLALGTVGLVLFVSISGAKRRR